MSGTTSRESNATYRYDASVNDGRDVPSGTVTFLFTDIEGSTRLWDEHPDQMADAIARHDLLARAAMKANHGHVFTTAGDSFAVAFSRADDAVAAAVSLQRLLAAEAWPHETPIRVRMGIHTGEATERDGDYFGSSVNRTARLMSAGHGGQVLVSGTTIGLGSLSAAELVDLGEHRLKDLSEPLRVFQVLGADLKSDFPALRTLSEKRTNLPVQHTSFVGRDGEIERLLPMLQPGQLTVLTGVGGGGKTRLALHAGALVSERFTDGVWFAELAAVRDPDAVAAHVAGVLEVPVPPGMSPTSAVAGWIANRKLLLVVDNCEHVLDAAAELIEGLRDRCAGLGILATSREGLAVDGEAILAIAPLNGDASVELFCDRSGLAVASLPVERHRAIVELCGHLDGLPLALELAAARTRSLPPEEIGRRLGERFRLLGGTKRARSDRHRTLRTAIDWSYQLLEPKEQDLFCRMAVFAGRFGLDGAEALAEGSSIAPDDVIDVVDRLVDKSMLVADTSGTRPLYGLLESLRDYGLDQLTDGDGVRRLHAQFHGRLVQRLIRELRTNRESAALDELDNAWADIRSAVGWAVEADDVDSAMELLRGLGYEAVFRLRPEVGDWAERALAMTSAEASSYASQLYATAAMVAAFRGDFELARRRIASADELREPDASFTFDETYGPAVVSIWSGRPDEAYHIAQRIAVAQDLTPEFGTAWAEYNRVLYATYLNNDAAAEQHLANARHLSDHVYGPTVRAAVPFAQGTVQLRDRPAEARESFLRALTIASEVRCPWYHSAVTAFVANIDARLGDPVDALGRFRSVLNDMREGDNYGITGATIKRVACCLGRIGRFDVGLAAVAAEDNQQYRTSILPDLNAQIIEFQAAATTALSPDAIAEAQQRGARWSIADAVRACIDEIDTVLAATPAAASSKQTREDV